MGRTRRFYHSTIAISGFDLSQLGLVACGVPSRLWTPLLSQIFMNDCSGLQCKTWRFEDAVSEQIKIERTALNSMVLVHAFRYIENPNPSPLDRVHWLSLGAESPFSLSKVVCQMAMSLPSYRVDMSGSTWSEEISFEGEDGRAVV